MAGENWKVASAVEGIDGLTIPLEYDTEEVIQRVDAKLRLVGYAQVEQIHWEGYTDQIQGFLGEEMIINITPE